MKIDLVGPARRGLAMGLNEAAGYGAVAVTALATGYLAAGLRAAPGAVLPRHRLRRARPGPVHPGRPRDPRPRPARGRAPTSPAPTAATTTCTASSPTGRCSPRPASASRRCPRPARPGWSTTSTTAWPGACSRCCSPPPGSPSASIGVLAALYPAVWGLGQLRHRRAVRPVRPQAAHRRRHARSRPLALGLVAAGDTLRRVGRSPRSCSAPAPPWSTRPCSPSIGDVAHPAWRARVGRRLPALARRRLRRRRPAGRRPRRPVRHPRRHLGRRRPHRRLRPGRRRPDVRDPPPPGAGRADTTGGTDG